MQRANFKDDLKELMKELNLSALDVAKRCEVGRRAVYFWLDGTNRMSKSHYALLVSRLMLDGKDVSKYIKNICPFE